jgi:phosphate transport system substrate-binding protein
MSKKEEEAAGRAIVHIPTVAGAVVLAYNLPDFSGEVKLTGENIAEIFQGKISKWNDPKLVAANGGAALPDLAITPVYRTDGSGTTFVFTNYLAAVSEDFKGSIGMGKEVKFPVGQGGKGNAGVTAAVQGTKGSIGYVELNYAIENKLAFASVKNKDGQFVKATTESVSAAGAGAASEFKVGKPKGLAVNIWNQPGADAYPISAFTYILVPADFTGVEPAKTKAIIDFVTWATGPEAQSSAASMTYAPLAPAVQEKVKEAIAALKK